MLVGAKKICPLSVRGNGEVRTGDKGGERGGTEEGGREDTLAYEVKVEGEKGMKAF